MATYLVNGGLSGRHNPAADETTLDDSERFSERFSCVEDALNRARAICRELKPGGRVVVGLDDLEQEGFPALTDAVAFASRGADSGDWYVTGIDLRTK